MILKVEIPKYIEKYIFEELGGFYEIGTNIDRNINNNEKDNKRYLGTYFPRSLIESVVILTELYENKIIKHKIKNLPNINILDFGTGTGGNILGFMHFLKKIKYPSEKVKIVTIEGNKNAIEYQIKLFKKFNKEFNTKFKLIYVTKKFLLDNIKNEGKNVLTHIEKKFKIGKYDFISSFKFISEFYNENYDLASSQNLYKKFIKFSSKYLNETGIILLLDLVSSSYDRNIIRPYTTQIMTNEVKKYLAEYNDLSILVPAPCSHWGNRCNTENCYIQRTFEIEHFYTGNRNDVSNISYFVFAKSKLVNSILNTISIKNSYEICHNKWHPGYCEKSNRKEGDISNLPSGFKIN